MKNFLVKSLNIVTIFSMVFVWNTANAVTIDEPVDTDIPACEEQTLVSTPGEHGGVAVNPEHGAWTASISGAEWIWSENPIADPVGESTESFTRAFDIVGTPVDGKLEIAADNEYAVYLNGNPLFVDMNEDNYSSGGQDEYVIPAAAFETGENEIEFEVTNWAQEGGTMESNPAGLMYKLTVNCADGGEEDNCNPEEAECEEVEDPTDPEEESCPIVYARVRFAKVSNGAAVNGWRNWAPGGDLSNQTFVGGSLLENMYADEAWFPLTNPDGSVIVDADLAPYADVSGLAVERQNGKVRLVLYGNHNTDNSEIGGKEFAQGVIEIQGATWQPGMQTPLDWSNLNTNPRTHDPLINDPAFPMDSRGSFNGYINQYDYRFDRMRTWTPTKVEFHLVVTTGSDGFYASYDINDDCDINQEDPEEPVCEMDCEEDPVCEEEPCDQDPQCEVDCSELPPNPSCEETQTCENTEDNDPEDQDEEEEESGRSFVGGRGSSNNGGGSVLGATDGEVLGACTPFTEYHRKGDSGGEIARIQEFLNEEMDAGLIVDGIYGSTTAKAVGDFQQKYFEQIITPWVPPFLPRVTHRWYKSTRMMANELIGCPETEVYLEDPGIMYKVKWTPTA